MIPYQKTILVTVTAGMDNAVELPAPIRGVLQRLVVAQRGGTAAFTARVFNSERPAGHADDQSDVDEENTLPVEAFAVTPALTGASGKYEQYDGKWGYVVNELAGPGRLQSSLWLKLTPAGSGEVTYAVSYTVLTPNLI